MKKYLVIYNTLAFPTVEKFTTFITIASNIGVDFFEIGIPPKFAKYDGPAIRRSYQHVKKLGVDVLKILKIIRKNVDVPLIVLTYLDDYLNNLGYLIDELHSIEINYVLFPDMLIDYVDRFREIIEEIEKHGLKIVLFVSPSMPDKLVAEVSSISKPFLYYGLRPTTGVPIPVDPVALIKRIRKIVNNVLVVGFGLSIHDINNVINAGADGVAIGTSIVEALEKNGIEKAIEIVKLVRGVLDGV